VDDCLYFDLADLLGDYSLVIFSNDSEVLLNNFHALRLAYDGLIGDNCFGDASEVADAVKVVEVRHGGLIKVVVEGRETAFG